MVVGGHLLASGNILINYPIHPVSALWTYSKETRRAGRYTYHHERIMDPFKVLVRTDVESLVGEHGDASFRTRQIWVGIPVLVQCGIDEWTWTLAWVGICRNFDLVT